MGKCTTRDRHTPTTVRRAERISRTRVVEPCCPGFATFGRAANESNFKDDLVVVRNYRGIAKLMTKFYAGPHSMSAEAQHAWQRGALTIAIVRDPLLRFISGWSPRETLKVCQRGGDRVVHGLGDAKQNDSVRRATLSGVVPCRAILDSLEAHAHNLSDAAHYPFRRIGWIHWLTQTYFLSSTDSQGTLLLDRLDYVLRIETFQRDWSELLDVIAPLASRGGGGSGVSHAGGSSGRANANHGGVVEMYSSALERSDAICHICNIYRGDYECLGYPLPLRCRTPGGCPANPPVRPTLCQGPPHACRFTDDEISGAGIEVE